MACQRFAKAIQEDRLIGCPVLGKHRQVLGGHLPKWTRARLAALAE
jgi:hypothetical protein